VHSEIIQTDRLFPHFVTLQPYYKIDDIVVLSNLFTIAHNDKNEFFWGEFIKIEKQKYLTYKSIQSLCYETQN
jgi:hypothetical protein